MKKVLPNKAALIPEHAKQVFKGQIFDVYQWPQELFDGSQATFEMLRRPDTIQILAVRDGNIVVVHDEQPGRPVYMHVPGGRADPEDESWLAAAKRELLEETGLAFKNWKLVAVFQPFIKMEWFTVWFVATDIESESPQNLDAGERISVDAISFDDFRASANDPDNLMMSYAQPLLKQYPTLEAIMQAPVFTGRDVDR